MKRKPKGWRNEPTRHSLASRGIRTAGRRRVLKRRVIPLDWSETSGAWQDEFGIDLRRLGYHYLEDWDSNEDGLIILNPLMLEDPNVISLLGQHGILTEDQQRARGDPIVLDISGRGSFDGDLRISLEGAEELAPLLQSRGVRLQALSAFNSSSGTQKIEGRIKGVDVDLTVTHPGEDLYHVEGDLFYHIDRTFTRKELKGFYSKAKELM